MRATVKHLALVPTTIWIVVTALTSACTIPPLSRVTVSILEKSSALPVSFSLVKMTCINLSILKSKHAKTMLHILNPLTFVLISVFQELNTVAFFQAITHFSLIIPASVLFKKLNEILFSIFNLIFRVISLCRLIRKEWTLIWNQKAVIFIV